MMPSEGVLKRQAGSAYGPELLTPPPKRRSGEYSYISKESKQSKPVSNSKLVAHEHVVEASNFCRWR
jgi:hypothetical protein